MISPKGKIGICSDHAGVEYKAGLARRLRRLGYEVVDYGTDGPQSVDYPDYAHKLSAGILAGEVGGGIALCGTGNGMALTLNHQAGIRAGLAWTPEVARLVKAHNDANVLVLPARFISYRMACRLVDTWLGASFEGGRHLRRLGKI